MAFPEDLIEPLFKGILVIVGLVGGLVLAGLIVVSLIPIGFGVLLSWLFFNVVLHEREHIQKRLNDEQLAEIHAEEVRKQELESRERLRKAEFEQWRQEVREREEQTEEERSRKKNQKPSFEEVDKDYYKESELDYKQRELVLAWRFKRLKISPDGKSGAAFYWVRKRYNESS